jgi:hypothetical protein
MEMSPASEPGPDEPATQYEIDRFAALVEQLLGDTGSDDAASEGREVAAAPEVDRAHAEEVLAEALRAVGEQERAGSSRSRRGNNRRRNRRGQGRPLPGDAAVADAARRQAEEERLAAAMAGSGTGSGDDAGERPMLDDGQASARCSTTAIHACPTSSLGSRPRATASLLLHRLGRCSVRPTSLPRRPASRRPTRHRPAHSRPPSRRPPCLVR